MLEYSIPHNTVFKDVELASESDWEIFVEKMKTREGRWEANNKGKGEFNDLSFFDQTNQLQADEATQVQDAAADNDINTSQKKKKKR